MRITPTITCTVAALLAAGTAAAIPVPDTKVITLDGGAFDEFGASVGLSGTVGIAGAPGYDGPDGTGDDVGAAYLFDAATGGITFRIAAEDGADGDEFGGSVGVSGTTAIVGAAGADGGDVDAVISGSGAAYLFDTGTGAQIAALTADDGGAFDAFGGSVAVSGGTAIVGAQGADGASGSNSGAAYLFDAASGAQIARLEAADAAGNARFGSAVAVSGGTAIVGAERADGAGAAYLFDAATGAQLAKLSADDGERNDLFGNAVAISDGFALVGARGDDDGGSGAGAAYLFDLLTGAQLAKFTGENALDLFGDSVALTDDTLVIGARGVDGPGSNAGAAYLYDVATGSFISQVMAGDASPLADFGASVAISDERVAYGAPGDSGDAGAAYVSTGIPAPIPLPATGWLILGGLGGLVAARRARRSAAA